MADITCSGFLKSRTWFVVLLFIVIIHATSLVMFSKAAWQVRCIKHASFSIPCNGQNSCETVVTAVGESDNLVLLSVTVEATVFCKRFVRCALCYTLDVSLTCHAVFQKIPGQVARQITLYISHRHKCLPGSVSYHGLLVKTTTHKLSLLSLYLYHYTLCQFPHLLSIR